MEEIFLKILKKRGVFWPRAEGWKIDSWERVDFQYRVYVSNDPGYNERVEVSIDEVFAFIYSAMYGG